MAKVKRAKEAAAPKKAVAKKRVVEIEADEAPKKVKSGPSKRDQALAIAAKVNAKLGAHTVVTGSDALKLAQSDRIPTGVVALDACLGGGLPTGKIIEIQGEESSGKSTVATAFAGQIQRHAMAEGKPVVYIPVEKALDAKWCKALGLNLEEVLVINATTAEECLDVAEAYARANVAAAIIVDSVAALEPSDEFEKTMGELTVGLQARLMNKFCRKINTALRQGVVDADGNLIGTNRTIVLLINQQRDKIGGFSRPGMPPPKVTSGGRAIPYYADLRIEFKRTEYIKVSDQDVGQTTKFTIIKSRSSKTRERGQFDLYFCKCEVDGVMHRKGEIDNTSAIIEMSLRWGLVTRKGSNYSIEMPDGEVEVIKSRDATEAFIRADRELQEHLRDRLMEMAQADDDEDDTEDED